MLFELYGYPKCKLLCVCALSSVIHVLPSNENIESELLLGFLSILNYSKRGLQKK